MEIESIQEECLCCRCDISLTKSEHVNMIMLAKIAKWKFPVGGNVLSGESGRALAVVCDECLEIGSDNNFKDLKYAVEFQDDQVIYHSVEDLQSID